ncbi:MAG TPA: MFS transporter [Bacilli bacterium]|nr:MFS transporter [Bacilli bacterium]
MKESLLILKNRSFLFFWLAAWASTLADAVFMLGVSWLIVDTIGSGLIMGTFLLIMGVVRSAFMLVAGVYVDRMSPMLLMNLSLVARAVMMGGLMLFLAFGELNTWLLYGLAALFGFVDAFFLPSAAAARQRLVPEEQFTQSNALLLVASQVSMILGPVAGAFLVALGGYQVMFGTIAVAFLVALFLLSIVRLLPITSDEEEATTEPEQKKSYWQEVGEGFRYVWNTPIILTSIVVAMMVNAGVSVLTVALPFLADELQVGVEGLGVMTSGMGVGGAIGAILFSLWVIRRPTPQMNLTACLIEGLAIMALCMVSGPWVAAVLLAITGITTTAINVIAPSVNQSIIPKAMFGRVISVMMLAMNGSIPISQALSGYLVDSLSIWQVFLFGGLLEAGAAFIAFFLPAIRNYGKEQTNSAHVSMR